MALYSADLSKLAKKVTKQVETERKPKRKMSETQKANLEKGHKAVKAKKQKEVVEEEQEEQEEEEEEEKVVQPVKPIRKRVKKKVPVVEVVEEVVEEEEEEEVVEEPKKKVVRKKKVAKEEETMKVDVVVEEPKKKVVRKRKVVQEPTPDPEPVAKKQRKPRDPTVPPAWFEKYVQGVKKEEAMVKTEKVPAKKVKLDAQETAKERWDDGLTRDRVTNEVDNHMTRMYSMIFNKR
jgi:hypothetical protein